MREDRADELPDAIFEEAVLWHARLREPGATGEDRAAFARWVARDPRHVEAYADAARLWQALREPAVELVAGVSPARTAAGRRYRRLGAVLAIAAMFALAAWLEQGGYDELRSDYVAGVGEQERITLADGSAVLLNTGTALAVDLDGAERRVRLFRGEAYFQVARDAARPFVVATDDGEVRVTGTAFNLRATGGRTVVSVTEGRVAMAAAGASQGPVRLRRGQQVAAGEGRLGPVTSFDATAVTAWQRGQLVFYRTPLGEVVEELNRYQRGRILVLSDRARDLEVTGVFNARRPAAAIEIIKATLPLEVVRLSDYLILLR